MIKNKDTIKDLLKITLLISITGITFAVLCFIISNMDQKNNTEEVKSCTQGCHYVYESVINTNSDTVVINGIYHEKKLGCMKFCYGIIGDYIMVAMQIGHTYTKIYKN